VRADVQMGQDGRSKGYGTVLFESGEDAENAISKFNIAHAPSSPAKSKVARNVQRC